MSNYSGENQGNHTSFQHSIMFSKQQHLQDQSAVPSPSREVILTFRNIHRKDFSLIRADSDFYRMPESQFKSGNNL